jgi:hypothetical protein
MDMKFFLATATCILICFSLKAQPIKKGYFSMSSSLQKDAKDYGSMSISAGTAPIVIHTVLAYGDNVRGLMIRINNGFPFKLAPSQAGSVLNYVGTTLNIVLQPFEKATITFIDAGIGGGDKQLHVSGEVTE